MSGDGFRLLQMQLLNLVRRCSSEHLDDIQCPKLTPASRKASGLVERPILQRASLAVLQASSRAAPSEDFHLQRSSRSTSSRKSKDIPSTPRATVPSILHSYFQSPALTGGRSSLQGNERIQRDFKTNLLQDDDLTMTKFIQTTFTTTSTSRGKQHGT